MLCEEQHETPSNQYSSRDVLGVNEASGENPLPTCTENTAAENRQEGGPFNQSEEIQREIEELRRRDEEECRLQQQYVRNRIDQHLVQNGGDLSLLLSQHTVPNEVKCVQLTRFGQTKNIQSDKVPLPLPMKDDVLIRAHSCGVNFHDTMTRNGILDNWVRSTKPPFIMGSEVAGEIVGIGKNVTNFKLGDRVMALPERKAWSEYVVCREEYCFKIPDQMSYHDAVALTVDGIVSHSLLFQMGNLSPGKAVLLHSTPGGLGTLVTQMARTVPNTRVFKITAERMNGKHVESSDHAVHYIDRDTDYVSEIRNSFPHGVDLVLDGQHEYNFHRDFNLLSPMGKYVLFGTRTTNGGLFDTAKSWLGQEKISPLKLYEENKSICGFNLRNLLYFQKDRRYIRETFDKVCQMWQDGEIQAVFNCILQFDDFNEALQHVQEHGQVGKVILDPRISKEDSLNERDYYLLAEKNVKHRRRQEKSLLMKLENEMARREKTSWEDEEDDELEDEEEEDEEEAEEEDEEALASKRYNEEKSGVFPYFLPIPMPFFTTDDGYYGPTWDVRDDTENITLSTNKKEEENLEHKISSDLHEGNEHKHVHGFLGKLREVFSPHV